MTFKKTAENKHIRALRKHALGYPEVEARVVCTRCAFKARNKAFLFVGEDANSYNAMLKLGDSRAQAAELARKEPDHYKEGGHGWVTVTFGADQAPPIGLLEKWIDESFRLLVPKQLVAMLPKRVQPSAGRKKAQRKGLA